MKFVQRNLLKAKKMGVSKVVSLLLVNLCFLALLKKIVLRIFLMNWQAEGVNGNYRTAKFEEISPKKTEDIHVKVGHYFDHTTFFTE